MLENLQLDDDVVQEDKDSLGGFTLLDSGYYEAKIKLAYFDAAASEAISFNVIFDVDGHELRMTEYITSGKAKGGKAYYMGGKNKDVKIPLPGYSKMNDLTRLAAGTIISKLDPEDKVINIYHDGKEQPVSRKVATELHGLDIGLGVVRSLEDKTAKANDYKPTGETREVNTVDKFFQSDTRLTAAELTKGDKEAAFITDWLKKYEGQIPDNSTKVVGAQSGNPFGAAGAATQGVATNPFAKK